MITTMGNRRRLLAGILAAGVWLNVGAVGASGSVPSGVKPDNVPTLAEPYLTMMQMTRRAFGLPADNDWVLSVNELAAKGSATFFQSTPVTFDELEVINKQIHDENRVNAVAAQLEKLDGFGGAWIDKTNGIGLGFAFVGSLPPTADEILRSLGDLPYRVTPREITFTELKAIDDGVVDALLVGDSQIGIGLDVERGVINVSGPGPDLESAQRTAAQLKASVPIEYKEAPPIVEEAAYLAGGLAVTNIPNGPPTTICGLGLPFLTVTGNHPRPTTAGHCEASLRYRGAEAVVIRITGINQGNLDVSVMGPGSGSILTDDILVYSNYQITGALDLKDKFVPMKYNTICESQARSAFNACGEVLDPFFAYSNHTDLIQARMCSAPGDSGSAGYSLATFGGGANGVGNHEGGIDNGFQCFGSDWVTLSKVNNIEAAWQLKLKVTD